MSIREPIPQKTFSVVDLVALIVGIVIGIGIFKTPSIIAAHTGRSDLFFLVWLAGGLISLIGALCYAELATAYPHPGGDYHYLTRAFGRKIGFLFVWSRMMVIQPGSIAMLSFVVGDYLSQIFPLGPIAHSLYAALSIIVLTGLNWKGSHQGKWAQNLLTSVKLIGLVSIGVVGMIFSSSSTSLMGITDSQSKTSLGLAMVFVLLTFGGWNEAAYISAELRPGRQSMVRALFWGIGIITGVYLLINLAYLKGLGFSEMGRSEVVAADLLRRIFGQAGAGWISVLIVLSALGAINASIFTGCRTNYALGQDFSLFGFLGRWDGRSNTPTNALLFQGIIALLLVLFGALVRKGFVTMVEYTAPVFWFFFLCTGLSLFLLRIKEPEVPRPFTVPFYPYTPILFCLTCIYMLQSSIAYTGIGALVGLAVLAVGMPFLLLIRRSRHQIR